MIGKVKNWLGIEGVKLELEIPEMAVREVGVIIGQINFFSLRPQTVKDIKIALVERYSRGRGTEKLTDEYQLGSIVLDKKIEIPANEYVSVKFALPFSIVESDVDQFGSKNLFFDGLARAAKRLYGASSTYRVEAEANVQGVALNPFDKREIRVE